LRQKEKVEDTSNNSIVVVRTKRKNQSKKNILGKKAKISYGDSKISSNKVDQKKILGLIDYESDESSE
jgi:hypothetical protein